MLQISGELLILPLSIKTEPGFMRESEESPQAPAVIQSIETASGTVKLAFPLESVEEVIKGLNIAKDGAEKQQKPSDLYIPNSNAEVEKFAKSIEGVTKTNEIDR